jgi:hypothetical protein
MHVRCGAVTLGELASRPADLTLQQYRCENLKSCISLALDMVQWLAVVNAVMNLWDL